MAELTTKTGTLVAAQVRRLFGDMSAVQVQDGDILNWINAAQRTIVAQNPILQMSAVHDIAAGSNTFSYSTDRVQYIQSLSYVSGTTNVPLKSLSYAEAQEYIQKNNHGADTGQQPMIWYEWAQTIYLWPVPTTAVVGGIHMDYVAVPVELTALSQTLSLPDRYFEAVVDYVLMKANLLDENWMAVQQYQQSSAGMIAGLSEQENKKAISTYPTITVREDDRW